MIFQEQKIVNDGLFPGMLDIETDINVSYVPGEKNYFEDFCGACDNYQTLDCPFMSYVTAKTKYKDIGCKSFWD